MGAPACSRDPGGLESVILADRLSWSFVPAENAPVNAFALWPVKRVCVVFAVLGQDGLRLPFSYVGGSANNHRR